MSEFWVTSAIAQQFTHLAAFPNWRKVRGDRATKSLPPLVVRSPYP
ncbi:hypothetical protein NDA01_29745 [Trichocoleus desertorum AS-A10]